MTALVGRSAPLADLLITGAHALDPRAGIDGPHDILIRDGRIAELAPSGSLSAPDGAETIDGTGLHAFPAFVDPQVHLRTPGQEHKEDLATGTRAAAAGGFGAIIGMPNTTPTIDSAAILGTLLQTARTDAVVPVGFLASVTRGLRGEELTDMAELRDAGALGFTDDGLPVSDAGVLRRAMQYQRLCGGVIALHEEDRSLAGAGAMHEGAVSARLGIAGIPSIAESVMIARDAAIARYEDARVHMLHLSCVESVEAVAVAKDHGVRISAEVCPHHVTLTDAATTDLDTSMKMNPPLRSEQDRQALIEALRSGVIDCVATDHAPHARHEKEVPFEQAPMGTTGLETAFPAIHTELVRPGVLTLPLVVERMTAGAALYDLPTPTLAVGSPADLTLIDLDATFEVGADGYRSRSANCCFHGRTLHGVVRLTIAAGSIAHRARTEVTA